MPAYLLEKIDKKLYRDVYIDLNTASVPNTKILISDVGADGLKLRRRENEPFDTVERNGRTTAFDGDWNKAKLSEKEYLAAYAAADEDYTTMLRALLAQLKKP